MSRIHRIGRSLGVASIGLILVSGASFAHDAAFDAQPSAPAWGTNDRQGDDTDEVDALEQEDHVIGGTPDDLDQPAEVDTSDSDKTDAGEHVAAKPAKPAKVAKPAKAPKVHTADTAKSSDGEDANDDNDDNEAGDNDDQGEDQQGGDHQDGEHDSGSHDGSGGGGDD